MHARKGDVMWSHISAAVDWTAQRDSAMLMKGESGAHDIGVTANAELVGRGIWRTLHPLD
jgi:hypothetical protein